MFTWIFEVHEEPWSISHQVLHATTERKKDPQNKALNRKTSIVKFGSVRISSTTITDVNAMDLLECISYRCPYNSWAWFATAISWWIETEHCRKGWSVHAYKLHLNYRGLQSPQGILKATGTSWGCSEVRVCRSMQSLKDFTISLYFRMPIC